MTGFGENLRRERELRGISLQEISGTTKISVRLLEALEEEDFSKLPGGIFIRSFIRSYANYLGLDEEQVMAEYHLVAPARGDEDFSRLGVTGTSNKKAQAPFLPWIIAVILLAGGYAIFRYSHRSPEVPLSFGNPPPASKAATAGARAALQSSSAQPPPVLAPAQGNGQASPGANTANPNSSPPGVTPSVNPQASAAPVTGTATGAPVAAGNPASPQTANSTTPAGSQGSLVLQVVATEQAWISVKADGKTVLGRVLRPNEVETVRAKTSFDVTTGNAQGTVLTLNGVTLKPLGREGEVKTLHLTQDDLKDNNP